MKFFLLLLGGGLLLWAVIKVMGLGLFLLVVGGLGLLYFATRPG